MHFVPYTTFDCSSPQDGINEKEININRFWSKFKINNLLNRVNDTSSIRLTAFLLRGLSAIYLTTTTGSELFFGIVPTKIAVWAAFIGASIDFAWNSILPALIFLISALTIIAISIFVRHKRTLW